MIRRAAVGFAMRKLGAALAVGVLVAACASTTSRPSAFRCETAPRVVPPPAQSRQRQALDAPSAVPQNVGLRLELLEQTAGLHKELDETEYFKHEAEVAEVLAIRERIGRIGEPAYARALYWMGRLQWRRSRADLAEATLLRCRDAAERIAGHRSLEYADCQFLIGVVYNETGRYAEAERALSDAIGVKERLLGPKDLAIAYPLLALGSVYISLGDFERAQALNLRALAIREDALGPCGRVVGDSYYTLGFIYRETGQAQRAVAAYERSLAIRTAWLRDDDALVAQAMSGLGLALTDLGQHAKARAYLWRSLEIRDRVLGADHQRTVISVANLVESLRIDGKLADAGPLLQRGLRGAFASGDPKQVWRFLDAYREYHQQLRQYDAAIFFGKQAVNTIQELRARLTNLDRELQRSFVGNKRDVYEGLADLLIERGRLPEAQAVLAMLKEEEYFDYVRRDGAQDARTTQVGVTGKEQPWQDRYQRIAGQVAALGAEQETLRGKARKGGSDALSVEERARLDELGSQLQSARKAFDTFLAELVRELGKTAPSDARKMELGEKNLLNLRALQSTLRELGERSGAPVAVLHYLVADSKLHAILTTAGAQLARTTAVSEKVLNAKIAAYRDVLQNPLRDPLPLARELYQLVMAPVAEELRQAGAKTLMLSLDGALRYLPLAALHDGKQYVAENYRLAMFTEAAKDKIKDAPAAAWKVAGMGLTHAVEGFNALPAVKEELASIVRTGAGASGVLPGVVNLDQDFTAVRMKQALVEAYPVLHIASHFVFNAGTETDSFLVLGDGTHLSLEQLRENDFDFGGVDLITLSACETAVGGGQDANGREIEGFGALAQRQGAKGVVATLWPVADESTGLFMREFYRLREAGHLTKAEAMRQAQIALLKGSVDAAGAENAGKAVGPDSAQVVATAATASRARYAHPYFWAPFILMGNWL